MDSKESRTDGSPEKPVNHRQVSTDGSSIHSRAEVFGHAIDADEALKLVGAESTIVVDAHTDARLQRKIDAALLPLMCLTSLFLFVDKNALSYTSVLGIQKDIGLVGDNYAWLGSIYYFGYLIFEPIAVRLCQRLPIGKYSGLCIIWWGIMCCMLAVVRNFAGAMVVRFILGMAEASVYPGFSFIVTQWYTAKEQGVRTAWWYGSNAFGQLLGGFIAYGVAVESTRLHYAIAAWRVVPLILGCCTIAIGIAFTIVLPDSQQNAWWLSPQDRLLAVERVRANQQGIGNRHFKWYQFREALLDPVAWALTFYSFVSSIPNGGLTNFFGILIKSFGYTPTQTLIYSGVTGALNLFLILVISYCGQHFGSRILWGSAGIVLGLIGAILLVALPLSNNHGRLGGFYLASVFIVTYVVMISLLATNVAGYTKKTTVMGMFFVAYCIGNIIGPQTFQSKDAPYYVPAEITLIVCYGVCIVDVAFIYLWYRRRNAERRRARAAPGYVKVRNQEFLDLTDGENLEFTYTL